MHRRSGSVFLFLVAALVLSAGLRSETPAAGPGQVTVFLVRHAEKAKDDPRDPSLSEAGRRRASELARVLSDEPVTHLFSSEYKRTRDTLQPLAEARGIEVRLMPAGNGPELQRAILALPPGSVAVVAGHSNTVPAIAAGLGGELTGLTPHERGDRLGDDEYDRLFVLVLTAEGRAVETLELRYGK
jgi:phosphohistidine phosphatase SixA